MLSSDLFYGLVNLERLVMRCCHLETLPDGLFSSLTNLKVLDMHYNFLDEINTNTFIGLENLRVLILNTRNLSIDVFNHLKKLEKLYIFQNCISTELNEQLKVKYPNIVIGINN